MMSIVKKIAAVKEDGDQFIEAGICMFLMIMVFAIMIMTYSIYMAEYAVNDKVNMIQSAYLLRMETTGYLTATDRDSLLAALEEAGVSSPSLGGTTISTVDYGEKIQLTVSGEVDFATNPEYASLSKLIVYIRTAFNSPDFGKYTYGSHTITGTSKG
jgi:hypothetical protein